jgi:hypothetical protein
MTKNSKIDSGDHEPSESIDPPPPYMNSEETATTHRYENPYPEVPESFPEPSAPPAQDNNVYVNDMNDVPPNLPVARANQVMEHPIIYYGERRPLLDNRSVAYYRHQGFPSAALIFLFGWSVG